MFDWIITSTFYSSKALNILNTFLPASLPGFTWYKSPSPPERKDDRKSVGRYCAKMPPHFIQAVAHAQREGGIKINQAAETARERKREKQEKGENQCLCLTQEGGGGGGC